MAKLDTQFKVTLIFSIVLLIIAFAIFISYVLVRERDLDRTLFPTIELCAANKCVVNLVSGIKRCPTEEGGQLEFDSLIETCVSRFICDSRLAPYAVLSDGSTDVDGNCEPGVECRCVGQRQAPFYITSYFISLDGSRNDPLQRSRLTLYQQVSYKDLAERTRTDTPLLLPSNGTFTFRKEALNRIFPSECLVGNLAFLVDNFDNPIKQELACVEVEKCENGSIPLFNINTFESICEPEGDPSLSPLELNILDMLNQDNPLNRLFAERMIENNIDMIPVEESINMNEILNNDMNRDNDINRSNNDMINNPNNINRFNNMINKPNNINRFNNDTISRTNNINKISNLTTDISRIPINIDNDITDISNNIPIINDGIPRIDRVTGFYI